jgi:hypothetical protein
LHQRSHPPSMKPSCHLGLLFFHSGLLIQKMGA